MNCPDCGGPLRETRVNFSGARAEGDPLPEGTPAWACDNPDCQARWYENEGGGLQKVPSD